MPEGSIVANTMLGKMFDHLVCLRWKRTVFIFGFLSGGGGTDAEVDCVGFTFRYSSGFAKARMSCVKLTGKICILVFVV